MNIPLQHVSNVEVCIYSPQVALVCTRVNTTAVISQMNSSPLSACRWNCSHRVRSDSDWPFNVVTESWLGMRYPCTLKTTVYVTHNRHFQILTFSFLLPLPCGKSDKHMYTKAHNQFSAPH